MARHTQLTYSGNVDRAEISPDGEPRYWATKETNGLHPLTMDFVNRDDWMDYFYRIAAFLIELGQDAD